MLLAALRLIAPLQEAQKNTPLVTLETLTEFVESVVPGEDELAWRSIPWRPTLFDGLRDGAAAKKPVLLWAMNGHPLGST